MESNLELANDLKEIIAYKEDNLLVSVQDIFNGVEQYVPKSRDFWKDHLLFYRKLYLKYCNPAKVYASTSFSRCYITIDDKSKCQSWFEEIKHIWKDKDVIIVEGTTTHNGVGNDLFDLTRSVCRIIAPPKNAYDRLDEIYDECLKQDTAKDKLFLVTLGPAAKKLVYKLYKSGHRAIDIGQLDMEYEMYLMKATKKVPIFKHRIVGDKANREAGYDKYLGEIIRTIK